MISDKISRIDSEFSDIAEAVRNGQGYSGKNKFYTDFEFGTIGNDGSNQDSTIRVRSNFNEVTEKTEYTISTSNNELNVVVYYYDKNGNFLSYIDGWKTLPYSFTTPENCYKIKALFKNDTDTIKIEDITEIQLELGEKATKYEPPCHYKPREIPNAILDMVENFYKFLPTKKVIDGVCKNAVNLPIVQFAIDGNSKQKTTNGTNLCDLNVFQADNVTYNLDGTVKINRSGGFTLKFKDYNFKANTTYYMKWELVSGKTSEDIDNIFMTPSASRYAPKDTFTAFSYSEDTIKNGFLINESATFTNAVIRIWFSESQSNFEEYTGNQPSPSPDYPQDIEVIDTVNLFDKDKAISNSSYTGEIGQNIVITTNTTVFRATKIVANSNSITIDANKTSGIFRVKLTDSDDIIRYNQAFTTLPQTIDTTTYKNIYIYFDKTTITIDNDIQITPGTISKPYLPYGYIGIEQSGKNKFNKNKPNIDTSVYITMDGTKIGYAVNNFSIYLPVKSNTHYVISMDKSSSRFRVACTNSLIKHEKDFAIVPLKAQTNDNGNKIIIQTTKDSKYLYVNLTDDSNFDSLMIEENTIVTEYEPYHEPIIYPINLNGNILAKVGNIADVLNIYKSGKITLAKNIGKVILDDNINSDYTNIQREYFLFQTLRNDMKKSAKMISNRFTFSSNWGIDTESIFYGGALGNRIQVKILSSRLEANDLESLKKWLSANNVEVYYELIEEENFDLTSIKPIKTWEGTNIFSLITNLETEYSVEYVVDKNSIVNESEVSRRRKEQ